MKSNYANIVGPEPGTISVEKDVLGTQLQRCALCKNFLSVITPSISSRYIRLICFDNFTLPVTFRLEGLISLDDALCNRLAIFELFLSD